jgi:tRNA(fMet)-specific endonuclease VapC
MIQFLVDTNAYSAFRRGVPEAVELVRRGENMVLSPIVLGELLAGFALGTDERRNRRELDVFLGSPRVSVSAVTEETAGFYARIYGSLRRKGRPIPTNDLWIAAAALQHGMGLFTFDGHFREVDGLKIGRAIEDFLL